MLLDKTAPDAELPDEVHDFIADVCRETDQPVPGSAGDVIRCCLESLALRYREVHSQLEHLVGRRIDTIHIVGGGSQNELLSQLTADACGRTVITGPVEATAIGNIMVQAESAGEVGHVGEARELIGQSFPKHTYEPDAAQADAWQAAAERKSMAHGPGG